MTDQSPVATIASDLPLAELAQREHLSTRAVNVCRENGLTSLSALLAHFNSTGSFAKLRNVGRLTDDELQRICRKYDAGAQPEAEDLEPGAPETGGPTIRVDWASLSPEHRDIIDRYLKLRLESVSARVRSLLNHIYPRVDRSAEQFETYFSDPANVTGHRNAGRTTVSEVRTLRDDLVAFAERSRGAVAEQTMFAQFADTWCERFGLDRLEVNKYRQDFIARRFPLFRFLWSLLNTERVFNPRDLELLRHRHPYVLGATRQKLEETGGRFGITRERARQLSVQIPAKVREVVAAIGPLYDFVAYEAMQGRSRDLVIIDEEFAAYVNAREGVSFTSTFYATVFEALLNDTHDHVKEDFDASTDYLVRKELTEVFDFDAYVRDLNERLNGRIAERTVLDLDSVIEEKLPKEHRSFVPRIKAVCELIAREEFGIAADDTGDLIFERNTKLRQFEYIVAELEKRGEPMHVVDLFAAIDAEHPGVFSDAEAIRGTILRTDRFARFDTSSTYGLKEWEKQYSHLKSGSFADIAEQFLRDLGRPGVLNEVVDYVMQYRKTTRQNVITTLKLDATRRFKFSDDSVVSLASFDYPSDTAMVRPTPPRLLDGITQLIADHGNAVALSRLVDYCVLRYRMTEDQARGIFDRAIREGQLEVDRDEMVSVVARTAEAQTTILEALAPDYPIDGDNQDRNAAAWKESKLAQIEHHPARRVLELVAALHRMGYEQLRIAPGMSASGLYWRCAIVPASSIDRQHGALVAGGADTRAMYSSAAGAEFFDWTDAASDTPEELAAKFVERFPELARAGVGADPAYAMWYREMLALTEPGWYVYAYADYEVPDDHLPVTSQGNAGAVPPRVPLPPVPEENNEAARPSLNV